MRRLLNISMALQLAFFAFGISDLSWGVASHFPKSPEYVSPQPGARFVPPETTIAFRPREALATATIGSHLFSVVGTRSGTHEGSAVLADDQKTVIFRPTQPFALGESVSVVIGSGIRTTSGQSVNGSSFHFTISRQDAPALPPTNLLLPSAAPFSLETAETNIPTGPDPNFVTVPSGFPTLTVTVPATATSEGDVFLSPFPLGGPSSPFLIIADNSGQPVYYKKLNSIAHDFKKQPNGLLTYWQNGQFNAMDATYNIVDTYRAGNGYTTDAHELKLLPNGNALLMIYDPQPIDMSQIAVGGVPTATVIGLVIQELDASKNVVFQWRSWDHFLITDTYASLTTPVVDYVHGNAIELDNDGNLLISSRHLSEVTKINRQTGGVIWRLGGKNNQFAFLGGAPFDYQHDIRRLPNGNITLFDNRTNLLGTYSRAAEYTLNEAGKTATLVWEYRNVPDTYAAAMGNVQRLSNGNTVIGWGQARLVTELAPDNSKSFELALGAPSYRALRFPWHGYPTTQPTLVMVTGTASITLTYSWNGATDIAYYRVYGGDILQPTTLIATQSKTGFETQTVITDTMSGCRFYRIMPVDNNDATTQYSNEVTTCPWTQYLPMMFNQ